MITTVKLTVSQLREFGDELTQQHYTEVPFGSGVLNMELDWDLYLALESEGYTLIIGAFDAESNLVGYIGILTNPMLHHKGKFIAVTDCFYVHPAHRKGGVFEQMLRAVEQECERASSLVALRVTVNSNFHIPSEYIEGLGYAHAEVTYEKEFK